MSDANDALNRRIDALFNEQVDAVGRNVRMSDTKALYVGLPFDVDEACIYTTSIVEDVVLKVLGGEDLGNVLHGAFSMALLVGGLCGELSKEPSLPTNEGDAMQGEETTRQNPSIGRIVVYRSRTGDYDVPAVIAATQDSLFAPNVEAGRIPGLSSDQHVHLVVFSPGPAGKRAEATDFKVESPHGRSENAGGTYAEWDIPLAPVEGPEPGTWRWPSRV